MGMTEYSREAFDAATEALGDQGPIYMINMVRYRTVADYEGGSDLPPCSGREVYFNR